MWGVLQWVSTVAKKRLFWIVAAFLLFGVAIVWKLVMIQLVAQEQLTIKAKENWDREIPFTTKRGSIVDRHGEVIVTNRLAPTLYFMPAQNAQKADVAAELASVLEVDESKLLTKLEQRVSLVKLAPEGKNISYEQAVALQQKNIAGLYTGVDYVRHYPHGALLARLLGFTGADYQGLAGLEYAYDKALTGSDAAIRLFTDAKGTSLAHVDDEWREGVDGATVALSIDLSIQKIVERELSQAMLRYNADQALGIAMNPNSGEIYALASFPTYDPMQFARVDPSIYNRNLPVFMAYEPGSTFKIITLSAALEEGVVNLHNDAFYDAGYSLVEGARLRCWKREGHKHQTYLQVVENSCNPGFIELGQRVGRDKLMSYIKQFGFGEKTGSGIAGEASGILFSEAAFGPVEHATTSFGQGISVTPIQQVQAVAAAINGGQLYTPYVVQKIFNEQTGEVLLENKPQLKREVVSAQTSAHVRQALESVVANGSGRQAYRDGLRIAGKTGTAQKVENGRYKDGDYIVSFIGFAPANDPQILVYVAIDHPKSTLVFGSTIAAPIVGQIIEDSAPVLRIEKQAEQLERKYVWGDALTERVPNFVGQSVDEIAKQLYPYPIELYGQGKIVKAQLPKANELMEQTDPIHLFLGE